MSKKGYSSNNYSIVYFYSAIVTLGSISFGFFLGVFNAIASYEVYYNGLQNDEQKKSEFVGLANALFSIGGILGCKFSPLLLKLKISYKAISFISDMIGIVGCLICCLNLQSTYLYIGRIISGIYAGLYSTFANVFVKEISPSEVQGYTGTFNQLLITVGLSLSFSISFLVPQASDFNKIYETNKDQGEQILSLLKDYEINVKLLYLIPALFLILRMFLMIKIKLNPPYYNIKEYETYFTKIYITEEDMHKGLEEIKHRLEGRIIPVGGASHSIRINREKIQQQKTFCRRMAIAIIIAAASQLSGVNAILFYSNEIFEMTGNGDQSKLYTLLLGLLQVVVTLLSGQQIQKQGRKTMLIIGQIVIIFSLMTLALSSSLEIGILSLIAVCFHLLGFSISYGPITFLYIVEILEDNYVYLAVLNTWLFSVLIAYAAPFLITYTGIMVTFSSFALLNVFLLGFLYFFAIETSGKPFHQIVQEYNGINTQQECSPSPTRDIEIS